MTSETWIRRLLLATVFTTGAAVLIVEVAAVRILAPYFGTSLFVLSSVLTVILLALSLGYYLGGKFSDRFPYVVPLYGIITTGGLSLLLLTLVSMYYLPTAGPMTPLMVGPLFFSLLFFFLPAFLLGVDSPYVIKLLSDSVEDEVRGGIVGATFFWSTAGSITGSIAAGFFLIPLFGLSQTMIATGVILVILGIGGGLLARELSRRTPHYDPRNEGRLDLPIYIALGVMLTAVYLLTNHTTYAQSLFVDDGYYSNIRIFDDEYYDRPTRFMKRDINNSSAIYLDSDDLVYPYSQFSLFYEHLVPEAQSYVMLGGGAYTIPRAIHQHDQDMHIDVVELEPSLYDLSTEYFRLPETDRIKNHVADARVFIARSDKQYDVIFMDTFSTGHFVPPHLVTREYFELLRKRLTENGVVIINFIGARPGVNDTTLTGSFTKTVQSVFPNFSVHTTRLIRPELPQNLMYILRNGDAPLTLPDDLSITIQNERFLISEFKIEPETLITEKDVIFTDDHTPVELLLLKERFLY